MSDTQPTSQPVEIDLDEAFDSWLEGSGIPQRSVVVYAKPQLYAQFQELERRMKALTAAVGKDAAQSDPELTDLEGEYQRLYDEWMESKSTWFVRGLTDDDRDIIKHGLPSFEPLPSEATDADKAQRERKLEAAQVEANLRTIAVSTIRIEFADRALTLPTIPALDSGDLKGSLKEAAKVRDRIVAKLRGMLKAVGERPVLNLMAAIADASASDPVVTAPKSQKQSDAAQA